jgi:predicted metal-dependent phosphoesterase TrpH
MLTRGDFHIHSTASDGSLSPGEIVIRARDLGVDTIAITDHNSTAGIDEAAAAGRLYGVAVIPGVELSTEYKGEAVHVLGYFKDCRFKDETLQEVLRLIKAHSIKKARSIFGTILNTRSMADHITVYEGINLLKGFGASTVLAHPVRISIKNLPEILNMPFDGIEGKYCNCSHYKSCSFIQTLLQRYKFYTGGSDFHKDTTGTHIHCSIGNPSLNQKEIQMFLKNSGAAVLNLI